MAKTTTTTTVTINGVVYEDSKGYIADIIKAGFLVEVKAESKATKATKSKKASTPKVLKVDKNGLQWIGEFNNAEYRAMSEKMFGKAKPGKANREAVYRACVWVL